MAYDPSNPDDRNPGWARPKDFRADWPDFDSVNWKKMVAEMMAQQTQRCRDYGFITCPTCGTAHTAKTVACRNCNYRVIVSEEKPRSMEQS